MFTKTKPAPAGFVLVNIGRNNTIHIYVDTMSTYTLTGETK
jgi:hypothetical protein